MGFPAIESERLTEAKEPHRAPLSAPALALVKALKEQKLHETLVFPSPRAKGAVPVQDVPSFFRHALARAKYLERSFAVSTCRLITAQCDLLAIVVNGGRIRYNKATRRCRVAMPYRRLTHGCFLRAWRCSGAAYKLDQTGRESVHRREP
jgi:hypothetical protein